MKSVLISIQPIWCGLIVHRKKIIEVRKNRPKSETPFKCFIYCTKNKKRGISAYESTYLNGNGEVTNGSGKVIGEFVCDHIYTGKYDPLKMYSECGWTSEEDMLSEYGFHKYADKKTVYGWHISDLVIYDKPKELSEFTKPYGTIIKAFDSKFIERPPQSWCYVEEVK